MSQESLEDVIQLTQPADVVGAYVEGEDDFIPTMQHYGRAAHWHFVRLCRECTALAAMKLQCKRVRVDQAVFDNLLIGATAEWFRGKAVTEEVYARVVPFRVEGTDITELKCAVVMHKFVAEGARHAVYSAEELVNPYDGDLFAELDSDAVAATGAPMNIDVVAGESDVTITYKMPAEDLYDKEHTNTTI